MSDVFAGVSMVLAAFSFGMACRALWLVDRLMGIQRGH